MILNRFYPHMYAKACWWMRPETAQGVARRLDAYLQQLARIDPKMSSWMIGENDAKYPSPGQDLTKIIEDNINRSENGNVLPKGGYGIVATSLDDQREFRFSGDAGQGYSFPRRNSIDFHTSGNREIDPSLVTYELFKAATIATIDCWKPVICSVRRSDHRPDFDNEGWFVKAWMTYITPETADSVDLVRIPIVDRLQNGGLLLSATTELYDPSNHTHSEAAQRISDATQHLNAHYPDLSVR